MLMPSFEIFYAAERILVILLFLFIGNFTALRIIYYNTRLMTNSFSLSLATSDILLLSFSSVIITSATPPFVLFVFAVVLWVSRRFSSPRISGRRKVSLSSLRPVWTEAAEAFRL